MMVRLAMKKRSIEGLWSACLVVTLLCAVGVHCRPQEDDASAAGAAGPPPPPAGEAGAAGAGAAAGGVAKTEGGVDLGHLLSCDHGLEASVKVLSKLTAQVEITKFDGQVAAYFHAMKVHADSINAIEHFSALQVEGKDCNSSHLEHGKPIEAPQTFVLQFPEDIKGYKTLGLFDYEGCNSIGHVLIHDEMLHNLSDSTLPAGHACPVSIPQSCTKDTTKHQWIGHCKEPAGQGRSAREGSSSEAGSTPAPASGHRISVSILPGSLTSAFGLFLYAIILRSTSDK